MAATQLGVLTNPPLKQYWNEVFLTELRANLAFADLGEKSSHPYNSGLVAHWLSIADLTASAVLSESYDPTNHALSAGDKTASLKQYGGYIQVSDIFKDATVGGTVDAILERLGRNAALSLDTVIRDTNFSACTVVRYGGTAVARNSIATDGSFDFSVTTLRKAVNLFHKAGVKPKNDGMYAAIAHPDVIYDIQGDSNWTGAHVYVDKGIDAIYKGETGQLYGTKFIESTQCLAMDASGSASTDVYQTYFVGNQAFGVSELYAPEIIVRNPSPVSVLGLYADYGWKGCFATRQLEASALIRYETGASLGT